MKITVAIPTYRRPESLRECLIALDRQTQKPDEVFVVLRIDDLESKLICDQFLFVKKIFVDQPGQVHANNAALSQVKTEIVAFTDDDAAPNPNWVREIVSFFKSYPDSAGLGGRDILHDGKPLTTSQLSTKVGYVSWFGKIYGNHHLATGPVRKVQILKGVNMSFRMKAIYGLQFSKSLKGNGAQVHNDMDLSLQVLKRGGVIYFAPDIYVDHYPAIRHDEDKRDKYSKLADYNTRYNLFHVILKNLGCRIFFTVALYSIIRLLIKQQQNYIDRNWVNFMAALGATKDYILEFKLVKHKSSKTN